MVGVIFKITVAIVAGIMEIVVRVRSLRERKSAIKRAARLFHRHLHSLSELRELLERFVSADGSLPVAADSVALLRHAHHIEHRLFGSLNKHLRAKNISKLVNFERIMRSVKEALHWRQKQFYNKV
uniref:Uncharacterized protein n=1 Tax=Parascaris univalens TaxID=6257 RepID=A0A915A7F0_PARUN